MHLSYHHRFVPGTNPAAPPLLLLHGTGGDENDLIPLAQKVSPGSALLSPRGDVIDNCARRFFARLAEGRFDPAEVTQRTLALADFVATATDHYGLNSSRLMALGFSNGANIAATFLLLRPESLAGAVLLRPMVVLEPAKLPDLAGKRVLFSSGNADPIVPNDHRCGWRRRSGAPGPASPCTPTRPATGCCRRISRRCAVFWRSDRSAGRPADEPDSPKALIAAIAIGA